MRKAPVAGPDGVRQRFMIFAAPPLIGISLPNSQRQHRTLHTQKDVLLLALRFWDYRGTSLIRNSPPP